MSGERAFSFSRTLEMTGAGVGAETGARAFKTALKILCKSSLEYLGILVSDFGPGGPSGCSKISDSGGGEESGGVTEGATEGATEGVMEGRFRRGRLRPRTEIILELKLIFSKNTLPNRLADPLGMEKLEL